MVRRVKCLQLKADDENSDRIRFLISSTCGDRQGAENLEEALLALDLDFSRATAAREVKNKGRIYYLRDIPRYLEPGFLSEALKLDVSIAVQIEEIDDLSWLERRAKILGALKGFEGDLSSAQYMIDNKDSEGIFKLSSQLTGKNCRTWASRYHIKLSRFPAPPLLIPGSTVKLFFPFSSYEINEKGGIELGENASTGSRVIYNFFSRRNLNVSIIGPSGSGKSAFLKLTVGRMLGSAGGGLHPYAVIIDPEGEYVQLSQRLQAEIIDLSQNGIDPISALPPAQAAEVLSRALSLSPRDKRAVEAGVQRAKDVNSLPGLIQDQEISALLRSFLDGPYGWVFQGTLRVPERAVIELPRGKEKELLAPLVLAKIWDYFRGLKAQAPKILVVDEGWLFINFGDTALDEMARLGRKINLLFLFASQKPSDFYSSPAGRSFLENSSTKLLMKQDEDALRELTQSLKLGKREVEFLTRIQPPKSVGYSGALLIDEWRRIPLKIKASEKEKELI